MIQLDNLLIIYVGSTIKALISRWSGHRSSFKRSPNSLFAQYVMAHGGPSNFRIELIEDFPCLTYQELLQREAFFIRSLRPVCNIMFTENDPVESVKSVKSYKHAKAQLTLETILVVSSEEALLSETSMKGKGRQANLEVHKYVFLRFFVSKQKDIVSWADQETIFDRFVKR